MPDVEPITSAVLLVKMRDHFFVVSGGVVRRNALRTQGSLAVSLGFAGVFATGGIFSANAVGSSCWPAVSGCLVRCLCGFGAKSGRVGWRRRRVVDDRAGAFRPDRRRDHVPLIALPAMLALLNRAGAGRPFALAPR